MTLQFAFPFLADLLMKSVSVLVLAFAVAWLLRCASAANRNAVWSTAFAILLLLPVTLAVQPRWSWFPRQQLQLSGMQHAQAAVKHVSQPLASQVNEAAAQSLSAWRLLDWRAAVVAVWLAGALLLLARRMVASIQLWKLKRRSISPPARILNLACETANSYRITRISEVRLSESLTVPLTWGFWRPVIMLPLEAVEWYEDILRIALRHEYAHVRRSDALFRLVAQIACAIHWMNPLVWRAARKLRLDQEQASDDLVLQAGVDPVTYADELVASVRRCLQPAEAFEHALAMAQPSTLEKRVNAVLDGDRDRRPLSRQLLVSSIAAMLLALAGSALAQVTATDITAAPQSADLRPANPHFSAPRTAESNSSVPANPTPLQPNLLGKLLDIQAQHTSVENGVFVAKGSATFRDEYVRIAAQTIRYDPSTLILHASGNLEFTSPDGGRITGAESQLEYNLLTKRTKVSGKSKISIPKPN